MPSRQARAPPHLCEDATTPASGRCTQVEGTEERTNTIRSTWSLAACALTAVTSWGGGVSAQDLPAGRVYSFHAPARGNCPATDWHIVAEGNGALDGMISWNGMQDMAKATGTYSAQNGKLEMTAKEVGGQGRTATIQGTADNNSGWLTADIQGPNMKCQGVKVPWVRAV